MKQLGHKHGLTSLLLYKRGRGFELDRYYREQIQLAVRSGLELTSLAQHLLDHAASREDVVNTAHYWKKKQQQLEQNKTKTKTTITIDVYDEVRMISG